MRASIILCMAIGLVSLDGVVASRCKHRSESSANSSTSSSPTTTTSVAPSTTAETSSTSIRTTTSTIDATSTTTTTTSTVSTTEVPTTTTRVFGLLPQGFAIEATAGSIAHQRMHAPTDVPIVPAFFQRNSDGQTSVYLADTGRLRFLRSQHVLCVAYSSDPSAELANAVACLSADGSGTTDGPAPAGMSYLDCTDAGRVLSCSAPACYTREEIFNSDDPTNPIFEVVNVCDPTAARLEKFYARPADADGKSVLALGAKTISSSAGADELYFTANGTK